MQERVILSEKGFQLTLDRLAYQLIEDYDNFENVCMIGIQESGVKLAEALYSRILKFNKKQGPEFGKLDITFYRDDYRRSEKHIKASSTEIDFIVEDKHVILVDDVLFSGRTVHAAMTAIQDFGRASTIKMLALVDRRFNRQFPIHVDYSGITVDSVGDAYVKVDWKEETKSQVMIYSQKNKDQS
jgi:pyrimidine operon attenuation protein / uracil phosphoribosyltransferase